MRDLTNGTKETKANYERNTWYVDTDVAAHTITLIGGFAGYNHENIIKLIHHPDTVLRPTAASEKTGVINFAIKLNKHLAGYLNNVDHELTELSEQELKDEVCNDLLGYLREIPAEDIHLPVTTEEAVALLATA